MTNGVRSLPSITGPEGPRGTTPQLPTDPGPRTPLPNLPEMPKVPKTPGTGFDPPNAADRPPVDLTPPKPPSVEDLLPNHPPKPGGAGGGKTPDLPVPPDGHTPADPPGEPAPWQPPVNEGSGRPAPPRDPVGIDPATRDALKDLIKQADSRQQSQNASQTGGEAKPAIDPEKLVQLLATVAQQAGPGKKEQVPVLPPSFTLNPLVEKPGVDLKTVPTSPPAPKGEAVPTPLNARLPPGNYKVELPQFMGWERGILKSILPPGATLTKAGGEVTVEIPLGPAKTVTAQVAADGTFTVATKAGEELRGRLQGTNVVVERWDVNVPVPKQSAEWRSTLPPPCPVVPMEDINKPAAARLELEAEPADMVLGVVLNLSDKPLELYLTTGEIVSLPPHGAVQLTARELDSPHIQELARAKLIEVNIRE